MPRRLSALVASRCRGNRRLSELRDRCLELERTAFGTSRTCGAIGGMAQPARHRAYLVRVGSGLGTKIYRSAIEPWSVGCILSRFADERAGSRISLHSGRDVAHFGP